MVEAGFLFTKIALVDNAVAAVSKEIYVGTASANGITYEELEQKICENIILSGDNCTDNLMLELTEVVSLADLPDTDAECEYSDIDITPAVSYNPGGSSSLVFMRVCFVTNILTPGIGLGFHLPKTDDDKFSIISSTAFVNEPF